MTARSDVLKPARFGMALPEISSLAYSAVRRRELDPQPAPRADDGVLALAAPEIASLAEPGFNSSLSKHRPVSTVIYLANRLSDNVTVIDGRTNSAVQR
jgi:hypothetical protein